MPLFFAVLVGGGIPCAGVCMYVWNCRLMRLSEGRGRMKACWSAGLIALQGFRAICFAKPQ